MTPPSLNDLIDSIRSLLDGRITSKPPEVVALEYNRLCREVNERLGRIAPMLNEGGEIQALQLAEQPPRILDLAFTLSFGGEGEWQEYCQSHGHEVAPLIDVRILEELLAIQEKGVSPNHPLYKDYRSAVSSRNDAKAYELIRIITRLNPDDENAIRELKRLEKKSVLAALGELKTALTEKNHGAVVSIMSKLEQSGDPEAYQHLPEWQEAYALRQRRIRIEARRQLPELMLRSEEEMNAGNWRVAAVLHREFTQLYQMHGADGDATEMIERANRLDEQLVKQRSEVERIGRVNQLTAEMCQIADEVEIRAVTPSGLTADFCTPLLEELARTWRKLEELRGEMPAGSRARIESTRARLNQSVERARSGKSRKIVFIAASIALVLLVAIALGVLNFRASGYAKTLAELRAKESTSATRSLIEKINGSEAFLLKKTALATAVAESQSWLDTVTANAALADTEIKRLETARDEEFSNIASPELYDRLEEAAKLASKLPADLKNIHETRMAVLKNEAERVMQKRQQLADTDAQKAISQWTAVLESIDYKQSKTQAEEAIKDSETALAPFLELANHTATLVRLPSVTESALHDLDQRLAKVRAQLTATSNAIGELETIANAEAYRTALESLAGGSFKEAPQAQKTLDGWPDEDRLRAFLLFRNDLVALKSVENDLSANLPIPEASSKLDRDVLSELMKNEALNGLWEVEYKTAKGVIQKGLATNVESDLPNTWAGKIANYPTSFAAVLKFEYKTMPTGDITVTSSRVSPVSALMIQLQLDKLLDDTGTEYRNSILPLIDRIMNAKEASPLARAYLLDNLFRLTRDRERAWGIHYCPELHNDIQAFNELNVKFPVLERSWLLQEKPPNTKVWEEYFAARGNRSFTANAKNMKSAVRYATRKDFILAGHVNGNGEVLLKTAASSRLLLGIVDDKTGVPKPCVLGVAAGGSDFTSSIKPLPFSPILSIEMPEAELLFLQSIHQSDATLNSTTEDP